MLDTGPSIRMQHLKASGLALLVSVSSVSASCPNDCSGKGTCSDASVCECYVGYHGTDCSKRLCSYGNAFVDTPIGDANGDNVVGVSLVERAHQSNTPQSEQYHSDYAAARSTFRDREAWDEAHFYQECSGKGVCDTDSGVCECFEGYTGEACSQLDCPRDCSGYGTCKSYEGTRYQGWDKSATHYCSCDPGFTGPACQHRVCPSGLDPIEGSNLDQSNFQRIAFRGYDSHTFNSDVSKASGDVQTFSALPFGDVEFTVTVTDDFGNEWTTELITVKYDVLAESNGAGVLPFSTSAWDTSSGNEPYYVFPRPLNSDETLGAAEYTTVSDQVIGALEKLPHGVGRGVTAHAVYVAPNINDLRSGDELDGYFATWSDDDMFCEKDGTACATPGLVGCGVPVWWSDDDDDEATTRNGAHDIDWFVDSTKGACVNNVLQLCDENCETVGLSDTGTIYEVPDDDSDGTDVANVGGFVYFATPYYDNDLGAEGRMPIFTGQSNLAADFKHAQFMMDVDSTSFTNGNNELAGLSIFIRFPATSRISQPIRVDYFYSNQFPGLFVDDSGLASEFFGAGGLTVEHCSTCTNDVEDPLVVVSDLTSYRTWDTGFDGVRKSFIGDGSRNADLDFHACSRRGLCDHETGLCSCFAGFTGVNCAIVNALASS